MIGIFPDTLLSTFDYLGCRHQYLQQQLKVSRTLWKSLPDGPEREAAARSNEVISTAMLELRDAGRMLLGINPVDDDGNPFAEDRDY